MESIANFLYALDDILWGTGMTVLLIGTGIILTLRFRFRYQLKFLFNIKNTYGRMFEKKASGHGLCRERMPQLSLPRRRMDGKQL